MAMFSVDPTDENYIKRRIETGEAVLVLGAGAVLGCKNARGVPLKSAEQLAVQLCNDMGMPTKVSLWMWFLTLFKCQNRV